MSVVVFTTYTASHTTHVVRAKTIKQFILLLAMYVAIGLVLNYKEFY